MGQLGQEELHGLEGDFQDRARRAGDIGGVVSTRRELSSNSDAGGAVEGLRKTAETTGGEQRQNELVDPKAWATWSNSRQAREAAGTTGGERLQGEAGNLRERQTATAQREQLPEEVWLAMSLAERKRYRRPRKQRE